MLRVTVTPMPLRLNTLRVGTAVLTAHGDASEWDIRILADENQRFRVLFAAGLSEPFASEEEALYRAEHPLPRDPDTGFVVHWRDRVTPGASDEAACPICGALSPSSMRGLAPLCPACVFEATDSHGRLVQFTNESGSGGLRARYREGHGEVADMICFVRGVRCIAEECRFGGVMLLLARDAVGNQAR